jgi:hypothetical protein
MNKSITDASKKNQGERSMRLATGIAMLLFAAQAVVLGSAQPEEEKLLTGKSLRDAMAQRRSVVTSGITLKESLTSLQSDTGIAIVLDRLADPSARLEISTKYVTNQQIILALANAESLSASFGDRFVLIGNEGVTGRLRTLSEINRLAIQNLRSTLKKDTYRQLSELHNASWPDLSEPRSLLIAAADATGLTIINPEAIPHDLWAAAVLPDLTFCDLATLILNQFDMTFDLNDKGEMTITPITESVVIEQRHRVPAPDKNTIVEKWDSAFPELNIKWIGSTAVVTATIETHEQLQELMRKKSAAEVEASGLRGRKFTMKVPPGTSVQKLLATFKQSGIRVRIEGRSDSELQSLLQQAVEFDLTSSPGTEFFSTVFRNWEADVLVGNDEVVVTFR